MADAKKVPGAACSPSDELEAVLPASPPPQSASAKLATSPRSSPRSPRTPTVAGGAGDVYAPAVLDEEAPPANFIGRLQSRFAAFVRPTDDSLYLGLGK